MLDSIGGRGMVMDRKTLERFISTETIDQMITKIQMAPDGATLFKTKCYKNQDVEETLLDLADVRYTIVLIGTECCYIKGA